MTPNAAFISEKNKEINSPIFLYTVYDYNGAGANLYLTGSDEGENVTFDGVEYQAFPISHEAVGENTTNQIDQVKLTLGNVNRLVQTYIEAYDFRGKRVRILTVFRDQIADSEAFKEDIFYIDEYTSTAEATEFNLSSKLDVLQIELPGRKMNRNFCSWKFKGAECAYSGGEATCNKTLQRCRELFNQRRFGGFPSIPYRRINV